MLEGFEKPGILVNPENLSGLGDFKTGAPFGMKMFPNLRDENMEVEQKNCFAKSSITQYSTE